MAISRSLADVANVWVTHYGERKRGVYRAESPDGELVLVKVPDLNRSTLAWLPVGAVEYIREPERVLRTPNSRSQARIRRALAATQEGAAEAEADPGAGADQHPGKV